MRIVTLLLLFASLCPGQQNEAVTMVTDAARSASEARSWSGPGAIARALAAVPPGSSATITIPGSYTEVLTSPLTVAANNVTLLFGARARLIAGGAFTPLIVTGQNDTVDGVNINGQRSAHPTYTGGGVLISGAKNATLRNATVADTGGPGVYCTNSTGVRISRNSVTLTYGVPIECDNDVSALIIEENMIGPLAPGTALQHVVGIYSTKPGASMSDILVRNNRLNQNTGGFGIEIGNYIHGLPAGSNPVNVSVIDNNCLGTVKGNYGCVSLQAVDNGLVDGTRYDAGGLFIGIQAVELVNTTHVIVARTMIMNFLADNRAGIDIDGGAYNSIVDNDIPGPVSVVCSRTNCLGSVSYNMIAFNRIDVPPESMLTRAAVWLQNNVANGIMSHNNVTGNDISGSGKATRDCIAFENDTWNGGGVMDSNHAVANHCDKTLYMFESFQGRTPNTRLNGNYPDGMPEFGPQGGCSRSSGCVFTDAEQN